MDEDDDNDSDPPTNQHPTTVIILTLVYLYVYCTHLVPLPLLLAKDDDVGDTEWLNERAAAAAMTISVVYGEIFLLRTAQLPSLIPYSCYRRCGYSGCCCSR